MNRALRNEIATIGALTSLGLFVFGRRKRAVQLGLFSAALRVWPVSEWRLTGKTVVITGGSRGLGLALAEEALRSRARVALLARDPNELLRAGEILRTIPGARLMTLTCDLTQADQVEEALSQISENFGRIDVLVNNAGAIAVGPFDALEPEDFASQLQIHVAGVLHAVWAVRPYLRRHGGGKIINISSVGGVVAVPHLSAYCTSKFALAGLSRSLAIELKAEGIDVTSVFPGLMRTGSAIQATFKGDAQKEYAWFALADSIPGISISAGRAARQIWQSVREGKSEVVVSLSAKALVSMQRTFPEISLLVSSWVQRWLPKQIQGPRQTGAQSRDWLDHQSWAQPAVEIQRRAEERLNQAPSFDPDFNASLT